ncbi:carboxypeptidase-like regulatory domain-containing protein [candidate division CSSED10-310 bacterium]|uniref:Carboxypeptidase-like regulatory domain-containing protein n=1 Tax=candidate division CSSED10-310 bacterium TaxID=2855610 RepID=A0ABV6YSE1_UNCC1
MKEIMKKSLIVHLSLILLVFVVITSFASTKVENIITGKVTYGKDKKVLSGAVVKAMNIKTKDFYFSEPTTEDGSYQLAEPPVGLYKIGISTVKGDYLMKDIIQLAQATDSEQSLDINVDPVEDSEPETQKGDANQGIISLRFFFESDESAVEGAKVYLKDFLTQKIYRGSKTDEFGCSFVPEDLSKIPVGEYEVTIKYKGDKYTYGKVIQAFDSSGTYLAAVCFALVMPDDVLVLMEDKDEDECECDLAAYLKVPFWKTPIGIAAIAGVGGLAGIIFAVWPTPEEASVAERQF